MRIGVNARLLIPGRMEGVGWYAHEVIFRLVGQFPEVEFVLFFDRPPDPQFIDAPNVTPVVLWPQARHPLLYLAWFEFSLPAALRRCDIDLYYSPEPFLSLRSDVPAVIALHDIAFLHFPNYVSRLTNWYYHFFFPRYFNKARRIVSVSEFTREDVVRHYGINRNRILVGGNGCRDGFVPLSAEDKSAVRERMTGGCPYFCYLGSVHPRKNVYRLIKAFEMFKVETGLPHHLVLAGRMGWKEKEIEKELRSNPFRDQITLTGYLPEPEPAQILGASDGLVYPSLFEGFGLPVLEAMYAEVPVLTSNVSSLPEVAGQAAILVDPESVADIARGLEVLVTRPEETTRLVRAGTQQRRLFSWEHAAKITAVSLGLTEP